MWDRRREKRRNAAGEEKENKGRGKHGKASEGGGKHGKAHVVSKDMGTTVFPGGVPGSNGPDEATKSEQIDPLLGRLRAVMELLGLGGNIMPYGSVVSGFSNPTSDIDLSYMIEEGNDVDTPIQILQRFAVELPKHGFTGIIKVFQASIPLLKAIDPSGAEVDFLVDNKLSYQNSRLALAYCQFDQRVSQLVKLVKRWSKAYELVGSSDGHLNSYAYTLLGIFYLMHTSPPVLPNLQDLGSLGCDQVVIKDKRWGREIAWDCKFWSDVQILPRSHNVESVEMLLKGFFEYYTDYRKFDWNSGAVSVRCAKTVDQKSSTSKFTLHCAVSKEQWYIEDPFDLRHNLASQCTREGRHRILEKMQRSLAVITKASSSGEDAIAAFERSLSMDEKSSDTFMLKCRVHVDKVSIDAFVKGFDFIDGVAPWKVQFPTGPRGREVIDAFLIFSSEKDRRRVHRLNETYIGEWQLRLLPCASWALQDALLLGDYEERVVTPPAEGADDVEARLGDDAEEEVRKAMRVAQSKGEIEVLVQRAQALGMEQEELQGKSKLEALSQRPPDAGSFRPPAESADLTETPEPTGPLAGLEGEEDGAAALASEAEADFPEADDELLALTRSYSPTAEDDDFAGEELAESEERVVEEADREVGTEAEDGATLDEEAEEKLQEEADRGAEAEEQLPGEAEGEQIEENEEKVEEAAAPAEVVRWQ